MCGLAGFFTAQSAFPPEASVDVRAMANAILHRGPDDSGAWLDEAAGIAVAHRRLSILDLSPAGHQPMASTNGRYVLVFNGEIYNHLLLREQLGAVPWRGHSDTETLLAAFETWGIEPTLKMTVGMFAIALWDREHRSLTLARDRLGEKPLYYGFNRGALLFASELKAMRAYPRFDGSIDRGALSLFLRHNAIPAPYSIYQGISKLLPGTFITFKQQDVAEQHQPSVQPYWSAKEVAERGQGFDGSEADCRIELERVLTQSVRGQMLSDVPLGAFLSGGVDSSTVVALMQGQTSRPVKTFTIGFNEEGYNEAEHAHAVARHLHTEHTEWYVTPEEAQAVIPRLPTLYDEPFADSSQIPTFLVSQLARQHVTVSLSGDGGDELFGGYNRYFWAMNIWRRLGWAPRSLRAAVAGILTAFPPAAWNRVFQGFSRLLPAGLRYANPGDKLHKLAEILAVRRPEEIYLGLVSHWKQPAGVVVGGFEPPTILTDRGHWAELPDFEQRMMYLDTVTYLPDDILTKVDRAAMGVSLETRVPLLDHRVLEFAWSLPLSMKIRHGQGKWLLRQVLYQHVPKDLIERPKMGFGIPLDQWLRGPLRDWAEDLLAEDRLRRGGFFDPAPIRGKWAEHLNGRRNWSYYLWDVLMFNAWKRQWH
ncbi:MAG TPA: asparagine synthase (glutamine-hydrolyzing) [Thiobacillaceae bacterium]|nr:asparagine synthase (glutamine-hydrolyzing) [Thiobacillaceae bacterium]